MSVRRGRDVLLKLGDGGSPEVFSTVGGLRTKALSLNAETVDATHAESDGWRELLPEAGLRQASISGAGVFFDDAAAEAVRAAFFAGAARTWQVILPEFGAIEGPFAIVNLDFAGAYDEAASLSIALESAGPLTFTAA